MATSSTGHAGIEMKKYYCDFLVGLCTRLLNVVDKHISTFNCTPELNRISQAVLTLSYIFRAKYRHTYFSVRSRIIDRKQFFTFCKNDYQTEKLPYFFAFLLHVSEKFEIFLYVREEGYNYFAIMLKALEDYTDCLQFVLRGGAEKFSEISMHFLDITKDLQVLVNTENPCKRKLLSFEESIYEIETRYFALSRTRSFECLRAISRDLYSGLQKYVGQPVLYFIILRHLLDGRVPQTNDDGDDNDDDDAKSSVLVNDSVVFFVKYFSRCLISDIVSGAAYRGRTRTQLRLSLGIQEAYEDRTNLKTSSKKSKNITFREWLPLKNNLSDEVDSDSDTEFPSPNEKKIEQQKAKEFNSNLSGGKAPTLETGCSSKDFGLKCLKCFISKPALNTKYLLKVCPKCHSVETEVSRRISNSLRESATSRVSHVHGATEDERFINENMSKAQCFETFTVFQLKALMNQKTEVLRSKRRN